MSAAEQQQVKTKYCKEALQYMDNARETLKKAGKEDNYYNDEYYQSNVIKYDKKLNTELKNAYDILHLSGYYDGVTNVTVITEGFKIAGDISKRIEPDNN